MKKISINDFSNYKFISSIKHSPDGKHACFTVHQADLEVNSYRSNLWLLNLTDGQYWQLTASDSVSDFFWSDSQTIIFSDIRELDDKTKSEAGEEFTQFYKISTQGGEAKKAFRAPLIISDIKPFNSDRYLIVSEYNQNRQARKTDTAVEPQPSKEETCEVIEEIPFWSNGDGFTSRRRQRLYLYSADTAELEPITDEYTNVELFNLNPAKTKVVMIVTRFSGKMPVTNELVVYDVKTRELQPISTPGSLRHEYADFLDDDTIIYTASDIKTYGLNENQKIFIANNGISRCITPQLDLSITNTITSDCRYGRLAREQVDAEHLYFVSTEGGSSFLNRINRCGKLEKLTSGGESVDGLSVYRGSILYVAMKPSQLQEVHELRQTSGKQLTRINEWLQTKRKLSVPEQLVVETEQGINVEGWVLKPTDFAAEKKYPAILAIHGGPKLAFGAAFFHELQYWAANGYMVFYCNPRGSDGRGDDFADIRGKYGTIDFKDIMKFINTAINLYSCVDQNRLGIIGGSYGGFMVNWIIGHTDQFRAAVAERSISNWISKFCTTDIGYYFVEDQITATPWNQAKQLWDASPLKYANRIKTPTLFIQADEDYRCWLAEGLQMFTALKYHGIESRLCIFSKENHDLGRSGKPMARLRRLKEITDWFDRYLN